MYNLMVARRPRTGHRADLTGTCNMGEEMVHSFVSFFDELGLGDLRQAGGKGANLAFLTSAGYRVPPGFVVKADAYDEFLEYNRLQDRILEMLTGLYMEDLTGVEEGTERIRLLMVSSPVPERVEKQVRDAYRELMAGAEPGSLVAVRSSVGTRDLSSSSFPGQMDTYHNVDGEDETVTLIRRCWASVFSYSAVVSRHVKGIDHFNVYIAPVVQLMVQAQSAGVVFTANPLNRSEEEMVVNACYGLGEGVVSGEVNADHYVIDKSTLEVLQQEVGRKDFKFSLDEDAGRGTGKVAVGDEMASRSCLSPDQLEVLCRTGREVERLYGSPQDIEWAYRDGELYLLQARRITTLDAVGNAPEDEGWVSEFDTRVDPAYPYYTLSNISEVLPGVLTPLTISGIDALDYGFVKTNDNFGLMKGIEPDSEHTFLGIFYNRAHLNLSVVKAVTAKMPGTSAQEFERMLPEDDMEMSSGGFHATPASLVRLALPLLRILYRFARTPRDVVRMREKMKERIGIARRKNFEKMPYGSYLAWMDESRGYRFRVITLHITASQFAVVFYDLLRKLSEKWLGDSSGNIAARLVTGLQNIESAAPSVGIWELSREVLASRELRDIFERSEPEQILEELQHSRSPEAGSFRSALDGFLDSFGYRSVFEAELSLPNWEEDPSYVFSMIKNYMETDPDMNPGEQVKKQQRERERALSLAMSSLRPPRRWIFKALLEQAQRYIAMREYTKASLIMGIAQIKREYHTLSRRFAVEGIITEPGDMFFLTIDEVRALARGGSEGPDIEERVSRRREEYERNRNVVLPEYSRGRPAPLTGSELEAAGDVTVLKGIAVSPGRVTGRARVITDPRKNSDIKPGEILVAPVTDAAWTPLFVTAGAIVVDVGGPLSHGSIVAREYGIPGVLNVGRGTRVIRNGQMITVDGDQGSVFLHPGESSS